MRKDGSTHGDYVPTVQAALEDQLSRVLQEEVETVCAGRTDAGVHALGQVVHVDIAQDPRLVGRVKSLEALRHAVDRNIGDAITIWRVVEVDDSFDARHSANERAYRYRIADARLLRPLDHQTAWHVSSPALDVAAMHEAAQVLVGEHDFSSFCRRPQFGHMTRRITDIRVERVSDWRVEVHLRGPAFCHQMVRSVTGCLVVIGRGERPGAWLGEVLAQRSRDNTPPIGPPHGLTLMSVGYPDHDDAPPPTEPT